MKNYRRLFLAGIATALFLPSCESLKDPDLQAAATRVGMVAIEEGFSAYQRHILQKALAEDPRGRGNK